MTAPAMTALLDGDAVRAPAPGWFHRMIEADHLIAPGDTIGELDVLGRIVRVVAPQVRGLVELPVRDARRAVGYGDVLFRVSADATIAPADAPVITAVPLAGGIVFRAPTSGRFYGRPGPDKPPFVAAGAELQAGTTICLLEVMKTFHRVTYAGEPARVRDVLVTDGADVNAGDPLLALERP